MEIAASASTADSHMPDAVAGIVRTGGADAPCFGRFSDECFVMASPLLALGAGDGAATLAAETAVWAYREVRTRPFYWRDKKKLMTRVFRTTNIALFRERKRSISSASLATVIVGPTMCWITVCGDIAAFVSDGVQVMRLAWESPRDARVAGLGLARYAEPPGAVAFRFAAGNAVCFLTRDAAATVPLAAVLAACRAAGNTDATASAAAAALLSRAGAGRANAPAGAVIVRRPMQTTL